MVSGYDGTTGLKEMEIDALKEVGNISMGSAATALSTLLNKKVSITTPQLSVTTAEELTKEYPISCVVIQVDYKEGLQGHNLLIIQEQDARAIVEQMMGEFADQLPEELGEMHLSAVSEAMNQMMGSSSTAMAEMFAMPIDISPPRSIYKNLQENPRELEEIAGAAEIVKISFRIEIEGLVDSELIQLVPLQFSREMTSKLLQEMYGLEEEPASQEEIPAGEEAESEKVLPEGEAVEAQEAETGEVQETGSVPEPGEVSEAQTAEKAALPEEEPAEIQQESSSQGKKGSILREEEIDALKEIGNISMGSAATALSTLLDKKVSITTPRLSITTTEELRKNYPIPCVVVQVDYKVGFEGQNLLIIQEEDARLIVQQMMGEFADQLPEELGEMHLSAVSEAMNQMMGSSSTAMADLFDMPIDISPPKSLYKNLKDDSAELDEIGDPLEIIQISFRMEIMDLVDSELIQLLPLEFSRKMVNKLLQGFSMMGGMLSTGEEISQGQETAQEEDSSVQRQEAGEEVVSGGIPPAAAGFAPDTDTYGGSLEDSEQLKRIRDIPVKLTGLLGRKKMVLKDVLNLGEGSVLELDTLEGQPIDILANGKPVAQGEIVVVDGQFGVSITSIVNPANKGVSLDEL